jgi:hypothetical protein
LAQTLLTDAERWCATGRCKTKAITPEEEATNSSQGAGEDQAESEQGAALDPFERRVRQLLDDGMSPPAIAGRLTRDGDFHSLPDLIGEINRVKIEYEGSGE